ncbi:MAG: hypothetical protein ABI367_09505 [Mucilaginibacter sp.]
MRYLKKVNDSQIVADNLSYANVSDRIDIRNQLINEQQGFCAYSERFIKQTDSVDIEHFDPRKKNTPGDYYYNWYATLHWLNSHKPYKIDPFLPVLIPHSLDLTTRIKFENGLFETINRPDVEAQNLIDFLGVNKYELYTDRVKHLNRINALKVLCGDDEELFIKKMIEDQDNLSFATAIEYKFNLDVDNLIALSRSL